MPATYQQVIGAAGDPRNFDAGGRERMPSAVKAG
jgi:hypothetical protein